LISCYASKLHYVESREQGAGGAEEAEEAGGERLQWIKNKNL
jgi:hypothetical protein